MSVVERVEMACGAGHEHLHDPLRLGRMMDDLRIAAADGRRGSQQPVTGKHRTQRNAAKAGAEVHQEVAAIHG